MQMFWVCYVFSMLSSLLSLLGTRGRRFSVVPKMTLQDDSFNLVKENKIQKLCRQGEILHRVVVCTKVLKISSNTIEIINNILFVRVWIWFTILGWNILVQRHLWLNKSLFLQGGPEGNDVFISLNLFF